LTSDPVVAMPDFTKRFYLQTDASNTGIGWTLSQKHDGMDRAVHYGGRALKPAEKNYPVIEKEGLAIVAAVKNLHNYLANDQFTILTDHKPLEYMLKTRDRFNKMIRWVLYLQAYDFVIEYRPGKANGNADALSRIPWEQLQAEAAKDPIQEKKSTKNRKKTEQPESKIEKEEVFFTPNTTVEGEDESNVMKYESEAFKERSKLELDERNLNNSSPCIIDEQKGEKQKFSAITESPFDKESIIRHQKADPQLLGKMEYLADKVLPEDSKEKKEILRDIDNYLIDDGVLYHVFSPRIATTEGTWKQLVIPKKYRAQILQLNHDEPASAHFGFAKTADKIRRRYYWPNMLTDIQTWVNTCIICQQDKGTTKKNAPLYPIATGEVFEALHCDVVGPFPRTDAGNRYVVVFIERLTAWPEAFAVASTEANVIAELLLHHIIFRFGVPRHFVTDQGKNFLSNLMAEVCNMLNIKQIKTTPYHPQSNGIVERLNGTLVKGISHFVASRQNDWDQYLPSVLFAYRTSVNESRKESPYYLMFGREATLPSDLQFNPGKKLSPQVEDHRARIVGQVQMAQRIANENLKKAQRKNKHYYDQNVKGKEFKVGDEVWLHNKARQKGLSPKLMAKWIGPFRITKKLSEVNYELSDPLNKRKPTAVHVNRLKSFKDPNFRVMEDEDKSSDESEDIEGSEDIGGEPEEEKDDSSENSSNQENQNGGTEEHEQGNSSQNPDQDGANGRISQSLDPNDDEKGEQEEEKMYMVERILKMKMKRSKRYFLIKWQDFPEEENTWEPEEHLDRILVEQYLESQTQMNAIAVTRNRIRGPRPYMRWSIIMLLAILPIVFGSRLGNLYDCTATTPMGVYEFPTIPDCTHSMNKDSKLITKEMEVFKYSPNITHFQIHYCSLYETTSICDWKPVVAWSRKRASKKESEESEETFISPAACIQAYNSRSFNGNPLERRSGSRLVSTHPNGKTATCRYWRKVTLEIKELTIRSFPAQVVGRSKYIEQHLTQTRCPSKIPKGQTYGVCHMKDATKAALVWNDPHHPAQDWHSLGKHEINQMEDNIVIPSLRIGGSIQNTYGETDSTLLLDNGLLLKDPIMKENMFEALKNIVTDYAKRMSSDVLGPILQAHIMRTLINQKQDIIAEWERTCFIQQEVTRIQQWMIEVFPTTAARWIHQERGVMVHLIGEAMQVHRCLKISNYRLITSRRIGNSCYHDIPVKAPYHEKIKFLRLIDRHVVEKSHKINCSERPPVTYLRNEEGSYDVIDKEGNITKVIPKKQFKGRNFVKLPKIRGWDPRMIRKPPQHLAPYSMLNIFSEIHDAMEEVKQLQMQHGNGDLLTGIGVGLGGILEGAASGTSQIIGALGSGIPRSVNRSR
uniref:Reverse transcriptase n=1 Tax=Clytia hemisphaerica TaxID=252671 RepID=A0A7M5XFT0_9CNID